AGSDALTGRRDRPKSDFYSADVSECAAVDQKGQTWAFQGYAFYVAAPAGTGACPEGTRSVHRYFRPSGEPNHRYVTTAGARAEMQARGWHYEGVAWCAGQ